MFSQRWGGRVRDVVSRILIGITRFKFRADFNDGLRGDGQQLRWSNGLKGEMLLLLLLLRRCSLTVCCGLLRLVSLK